MLRCWITGTSQHAVARLGSMGVRKRTKAHRDETCKTRELTAARKRISPHLFLPPLASHPPPLCQWTCHFLTTVPAAFTEPSKPHSKLSHPNFLLNLFDGSSSDHHLHRRLISHSPNPRTYGPQGDGEDVARLSGIYAMDSGFTATVKGRWRDDNVGNHDHAKDKSQRQ
jgi:hypothetical protein